VAPGSVVKSGKTAFEFSITDGSKQVRVSYVGPDARPVREGQGVGRGHPRSAASSAETILAKHDERYMPREVVDSLKTGQPLQEGPRVS